MKWVYKLQRFMIGRYGPDELYKFLFKLYISLFIINLFFNFRILNILELLVIFIMFYRFFSKKIYTRRKENDKYLELRSRFLKPFNNLKRNYKDRDYFVYKKCSKCKTTLKLPLPSRRGIQQVKCPKCKHRMKFLCLRQEKVEVIKQNKRK
ncbi:MAG: hypothetical protein IJ509_02100 [Bacilli bacterium]|nr:hypothetical protein [Bacilli bacterium]